RQPIAKQMSGCLKFGNEVSYLSSKYSISAIRSLTFNVSFLMDRQKPGKCRISLAYSCAVKFLRRINSRKPGVALSMYSRCMIVTLSSNDFAFSSMSNAYQKWRISAVSIEDLVCALGNAQNNRQNQIIMNFMVRIAGNT